MAPGRALVQPCEVGGIPSLPVRKLRAEERLLPGATQLEGQPCVVLLCQAWAAFREGGQSRLAEGVGGGGLACEASPWSGRG